MASPESDALIQFYKNIRKTLRSASFTGEADAIRLYRQEMEALAGLATSPVGVDFYEQTLGGVYCAIAEPQERRVEGILLCLHGGGYRGCSINSHRNMYGHMAARIGIRSVLVGYSLAPENPFPKAIDEVIDVYRSLIEEGVARSSIATTGDSAGGGLAIAFQLRARELGMPLPSATMLISPWLDVEAKGNTIDSNRNLDKVVDPDPIPIIGASYAGKESLRHPMISPVHADLSGFGPIFIQVGSYEVLLDDSKRLYEAALRDGVDARLDVFPEMQHIFPIMAGNAPEADDSIGRFSEWFHSKAASVGLEERN